MPPRKTRQPIEVAPTLRQQAAALRVSRADIARMSPDEIQGLVHELQVHHIELKVQNEELRRTQGELTQSHDRFNDLYDFAPVGYITLDPNRTVIEANLTLATMLGVERHKLVGRKFTRFVTRATQDTLYLHEHAVLDSVGTQTCELSLRRADGTTFIAQMKSIRVSVRSSAVCHYRSAIIDITERARQDEGLSLTMSLLRATLDSTADGVLVVDREGRITDYNRRFVELWRLPATVLDSGIDDEAIQFVLDQLQEPERFLAKVKQLYANPRQSSSDVLMFKDGRTFERYSQPQWLDDIPVGRVWSFRDVTARRQAEDGLSRSHTELEQRVVERTAELTNANEGLRESEERLRLALHASRMGTFEIDFVSGEAHWNAIEFELLGLKPGDAPPGPETFMRFVHPDDAEHLRVQWEKAVRVGEFDEEFRIVRADSKERWLAGRGQFAVARPSRFMGVNFDITERKRAEDELRRSEASLANAQRIAKIGNWDLDVQANTLRWSDQIFEIFGIEKKRFGANYEAFLAGVHPEDRERVNEALRAALAGEAPAEVEHRVLLPDGTVKFVHELGEVTRDKNGSPLRMTGTVMDITGRRLAEDALRHSEALLRSITDHVEDIIVVKDLEGRYLFKNPAGYRADGFSPAQVIGHTDLEYYCDLEQARHFISDDRRIMKSRQAETFEERLTTSDGREHILLTHKMPRFDAEGNVIGIIAVCRDITERKRLEAEVLRIAGDERLRLGADLHDGICQELAGVSWLTNVLRRDLDEARHPLARKARVIEKSMTHIIEQTRQLAHSMNPVVADGSGLMHALQRLAETTSRTYGFRCLFRCREPVSIENATVANELYRIAQEAIHNARRHGHAKRITVRLTESDGEVRLTVADDGQGLPADVSSAPGMGLRVMKYRAGLIRGQFTIQPRKPRGTEVICYIPIPQPPS